MPPLTSSRLKGADSQLGQGSKENTPPPDSLPSVKKTLPSSASMDTVVNSRLLDESFNMTIRYGDEYMDENPITGHPGEFHLSTTGRKAREMPILPPAGKAILPGQKPAAPPTPEVKTADAPSVRKGSKGDKSPKTPGMPKPKRRKSRGPSSGGNVSAI